MTKSSEKFLHSYINNYAPTGFESAGQKLWLEYIKPYIDDYQVDNYGTVVGIVNPEAKYKVVIEAHADEISWFVHYIDDKGFIYVRRNGGSDHQIAPSKDVVIHTDNGPVHGVFGWPAIHTRTASSEKQPKLDTIFIDVGANTKEAVLELGVEVGCVITFTDCLRVLNDTYYTGRALDNRIGGFMIAEVLRQLHETKTKLDFGLYVVNSVQEEVGLRGAEMISRSINPDVAIITDVCHDTQTPHISKIKQGDLSCGKGPVLTTGPSVHNNLLKLIKSTAKEQEIEFQLAAASRATGTDTDAFAYSGTGVVSALISLPLRYMHTTVEMAHKKDVDAVTQLIFETLKNIKNKMDFRYFT
ncbi:MAG: putative aminopeptidase FrvX [Luteibaculaceae bacterium]|jgi:putative aminopeptidase FrvX